MSGIPLHSADELRKLLLEIRSGNESGRHRGNQLSEFCCYAGRERLLAFGKRSVQVEECGAVFHFFFGSDNSFGSSSARSFFSEHFAAQVTESAPP